MKITQITCNNCGAPLEIPRSTRFATCTYCSSRLKVVQSGNAVYTEILEAIEEKAIEISSDVGVLKRQNELAQLDREWIINRDKYLVHTKHGDSIPTELESVVGIVIGIIFVFIGLFLLVALPPFGIIWLAISIFALRATFTALTKATKYREDRERYELKRKRLLAESGLSDVGDIVPPIGKEEKTAES